jgi:hypothetical protein
VDGVALASVITSGVLGVTISSIAVWSARQNAKLARETRMQQRLADSYLEVLRLVEREAQWFEASTKNFEIYAVNYDYERDFRRVELPDALSLTGRQSRPT